MTRDEAKEQVKADFARNPRRLVGALGLVVDEKKSKGSDIWAFQGGEENASLVAHGEPGQYAGLCKRFGDDASGDCFWLVQYIRPQDSFKMRFEFVCGVYGVTWDDAARHANRERTEKVGEASYRVIGDGGEVLAIHKRTDFANGTKTMAWCKPDGGRGLPDGVRLNALPLWRSWEIEDARRSVVVCEGEKDTDALRALGAQAVGTYGADCVPGADSLTWAAGRQVFLWPDNDDVGRKHMERVAVQVKEAGGVPFVLAWPEAPEKGGAADFVVAGGTRETLRALANKARRWEPPAPDEPEPDTEAEAKMEQAVNGTRYTPQGDVFQGAVSVADVTEEIILALETRRRLPKAIYGMRSGFESIDNFFGGFAWQGLMLLMAESGVGKTTLARHFMYATAIENLRSGNDGRILAYIMEGGKEQLLRYYAGYKFGFPSHLWRPGSEDRTTPEWEDVRMSVYSEFPLLPIDLCYGVKDADRIMFDIERRIGEGPIDGVILDNLQLLSFRSGNEYQRFKQMAIDALELCDRLAVPMLALTQVNRSGSDTKTRGGPDWYNAATCCWFAERGESGEPKEKRGQSNVLRLHNLKVRYEDKCMSEVTLLGDQATGRLWEQDEYSHEQARATIAAEYERRGY